MDLSSNYRSIVKKYFPNAMIVSDRFHVVKLILESFIKTACNIDTNLKKQFGLGRLLRKNQATLESWQKLKIEAYLETQPQIKIPYEITQDLMSLTMKRCANLRIANKD